MSYYCLIEEGVITDGPRGLPNSWRNISGLNLLNDASLKLHGWLPYIDNPPAYVADTQYLTFVNTINENDVTKTYTINDYTTQEMENRIAQAKSTRKASLRDSVDNYLANKLKDYRTHVDAKPTEVDAATTLAEVRAIEADLTTIDSITSAVRTIFENSILWDVDYSQVDTYIDNNVTTLVEAKEFLKKLSKIVLALLKFNGLVK